MYLFPFYKQYDSMQCGITCLQMICEYYNIKYSANFSIEPMLYNNRRCVYVEYKESCDRIGI